ncbi:hypothetical protein OYC64_004372 [Pagothenia borchgrevinki]|uniref:ZP-domain containing protein Ig-like domain-containing protein n=1 Tax=Pagothenia borchgrevinki TaxID=8213 RepID=A0ABD2FXY2_PAGBO
MDDPVIRQQLSKEQSAMQHRLDINFTLTVLAENEPFYRLFTLLLRSPFGILKHLKSRAHLSRLVRSLLQNSLCVRLMGG